MLRTPGSAALQHPSVAVVGRWQAELWRKMLVTCFSAAPRVRNRVLAMAVLERPSAYWEHFGMLGNPGYRADWSAKRAWHAGHGTLPWTDEGDALGTATR